MKTTIIEDPQASSIQPTPRTSGSGCDHPRALSAREVEAVAAAGGKGGITGDRQGSIR